jgi:hypothetical protein
LASALWLVPGCGVEGEDSIETQSLAAEDGGGHGADCEPAPIMTTGDFDGDGVIGSGDIEMISAYVEAGDYAAFFDMNADGALNGADVSAVATSIGDAGSARDAQMAQLWASTERYRDITVAIGEGWVPFTPDLAGHGVHWANFPRIYSWPSRGFQADVPEGLNYAADGTLLAAFYYAPGAVDLAELGYPLPPDTFYVELSVPASFDGSMDHEWHNHIGPCFGGATSPILGFDQCVTKSDCYDVYGGQLWSDKFHMLHVWMYEYNQCGPFAGIDPDVSQDAPEEPNHMACELADIVPCVIVGYHPDGTPMCADPSGDGGHDGH